MLRELPVRELMTTEVLTFSPADDVRDAMRALLRRDVDGAPVIDDGVVVGMLSDRDHPARRVSRTPVSQEAFRC